MRKMWKQGVEMGCDERGGRTGVESKAAASRPHPRTLARVLGVILLIVGVCARAAEENPSVTPPPESFFELVNQRDREAARSFYTKYLDVQGMPVVASKEVADEDLRRTRRIVLHLLAGRPGLVQ